MDFSFFACAPPYKLNTPHPHIGFFILCLCTPPPRQDLCPSSCAPPTHKPPFTFPKIISDLTFPEILSLYLNFHLFPTLDFYRLYH